MPARIDSQRTWWKDATIYQIWPASYKDSNGDGIGDIGGIISTLDYLKDLGIDIIWVSPMYDSPQDDMGYDVSNYEDIYPPYGSIEDAEKLIRECHVRGMRIVFDLVINHTSYLHAWFKESRASKSSPKRDWYIWRPAKYDSKGHRQPPNNWRAHFGGSAWEWDEATQEYYFHLFAPQQPDLNWENSATRAAIYASALTFWLEKGIDGFRIDTVNMYSKDPSFPDAPIIEPEATYQFHPPSFVNGPRMHEFLREMRSTVLSRYDCMTVGELPHTTDPGHVRRYVGAAQRQLDMVFQFDVVDLGQGSAQRMIETGFSMADLRAVVARTQALTPGSDAWSTAFLENHDQPRSVSRFGDASPAWRARSARLLAVWLATLTGTLFLYQGQELGTPNLPASFRSADFRDVEAVSFLAAVQAAHPTDPARLRAAEAAVRRLGRDNARAPIAWDATLPHAGFTTARAPWMRMHDDLAATDVATQRRDPHSVLRFWRHLLRLRRAHLDVLAHGTFALLDGIGSERCMVYIKMFGRSRALVALNFSREVCGVVWPPEWVGASLLVGNLAEEERKERELQGWEARVYLKEDETT